MVDRIRIPYIGRGKTARDITLEQVVIGAVHKETEDAEKEDDEKAWQS